MTKIFDGQMIKGVYMTVDLWITLFSSYNSALNHLINHDILNEIPQVPIQDWPLFSKEEFREAISKCDSNSTPGPDHISWLLEVIFSVPS